MTNTDSVWIINKGAVDFEKIDTNLNKRIVIKPYRPIQLPRSIAMRYIKYTTLFACEYPEKYFENQALNRLVIRDAGLGDLLLLEPVLRQMNKDKHDITIITRFPDIYKSNPHIKEIIQMEAKSDIPKNIKMEDWDTYDDLRSYSETCVNRDKKHRTDCYNQIFNINIEDKEPRLYFSRKEEGSLLKKKEGYNYIGIACDGSHFFRRYSYGIKLVDDLLKADSKNVVVILGDGWEDGQGFVKYNKKDKRVIDLQGKTSIRQIINIIKDLDKMVSVDTGLMHIALSLHIPTVCIFSIIDPKLRIDYYTGPKEVIYKSEMECIACGSWHMAKCKFGTTRDNPKFIPPCLEISTTEIIEKLNRLKIENNPRVFYGEQTKEKKKVNFNFLGKKKLTLACIALDEEHNTPLFIDNVINNKAIGRVIIIDGGSKDKTVELLKKTKAEVYIHPYIKTYPEQQAMQRNISMSYVKNGEPVLIMDFDEKFSEELSNYLPFLAEQKTISYGLISRRTFDYYKDINDPTKQIKDYPDHQPRYFIWDWKFKFVGGAHHKTLNTPEPVKIRKDIIHFEKESGKRDVLESQWAAQMQGVRRINE